ncbi:MAG: GFA family protein [Solirubrobacteraceae bacterium]
MRVSMCHCLACQRRTGSTYGVQARFPRAQVKVTGEASEYVRYADEDGTERRFFFCPRCGSTVYYETDGDSDLVAIAVGAFADPEFRAPAVSVWEARRHSWVSVPPGAERIG